MADLVSPEVEGLETPKLVVQEKPFYPIEPRRANAENGVRLSTVRLEAILLSSGRVGDIRVKAAAHEDLAEAARGALKKWRFQPARVDGVPRPMKIDVIMDFRLG
jgi:TonB family protein